MVPGAVVDADQDADEEDGPARVQVVASGESVPTRHVQDVAKQVQAYPVAGHAPLRLRWRRVRGRMSGATPVPVAGFQPYSGR